MAIRDKTVLIRKMNYKETSISQWIQQENCIV